MDGHLGYFQFLAILNKDAMNICVQVFVKTYIFNLGQGDKHLRVEFLGHMVNVHLIF